MDMRGGIDANGNIVAYDYVMLGQPGNLARPRPRELTGHAVPDSRARSTPNTPNTAPMYDIPNKRLTGEDDRRCSTATSRTARCATRRGRRRRSPRSS